MTLKHTLLYTALVFASITSHSPSLPASPANHTPAINEILLNISNIAKHLNPIEIVVNTHNNTLDLLLSKHRALQQHYITHTLNTAKNLKRYVASIPIDDYEFDSSFKCRITDKTIAENNALGDEYKEIKERIQSANLLGTQLSQSRTNLLKAQDALIESISEKSGPEVAPVKGAANIIAYGTTKNIQNNITNITKLINKVGRSISRMERISWLATKVIRSQ